uniref:SprT-like domain-containing protein n=1 Tax=Bursaphelenchus xylophilus TaxID=6326 RepID=A0A1I7RNB3_BURXY
MEGHVAYLDSLPVTSSERQVMNLADPASELDDPTPDLHEMFQLFDYQFFQGRLQCCVVEWSKQMKRCAGTCTFQPASRMCVIRMSEPLLKLRSRKDFVETLLVSCVLFQVNRGSTPSATLRFSLNFVRTSGMD